VLDVVAAVIRRDDGRILIARRPAHLDQGGLWEFPGGKREPGEARLEALARELDEELGIDVRRGTPLLHFTHAYPDKDVHLDIWEVTEWRGNPSGRETQTIRWIAAGALDSYRFPAANATIITAARLPRVLIMPSAGFVAGVDFIAVLERCLRSGFSAFVLPACASATLAACAALAQAYGATMHLADPGRDAALPDGIGVHLHARELGRATTVTRGSRTAAGLSASVRTVEDFRRAREIGVDWIVMEDGCAKPLRELPPGLQAAFAAETVPTYKSAAFDSRAHTGALREGFQGAVVTDPGLETAPEVLADAFRRSLARAAVVL